MSEEIPYFEDQVDKVRPEEPTVERNAVNAIVYDSKTKKVLCLRWNEYDWNTFIIGGIEGEEDPVEAAKREILEETGYKNVEFIEEIGKTKAAFYAAHKKVNRIANNTGLLFKLVDEEQDQVSDEELEKHSMIWVPKEEVADFINIDPQKHKWQIALKIIEDKFE